jgi:hypothetical protein
VCSRLGDTGLPGRDDRAESSARGPAAWKQALGLEPSRAYYIALFFVGIFTILAIVDMVLLAFLDNPSDVAKESNSALVHIATAGGGLFVGLLGGKSP